MGAAARDVFSTPKRDECDSHALNMLADLALSSCNSPLMRNGSPSPSMAVSLSREPRGSPKEKVLCKSVDHEYHRATKGWKGGLLSDRKCHWSLSPPEHGGLALERPSSSQEGDPWTLPRRGSAEAAWAKPPAVSPKEAVEFADPTTHLLISLEHSYASLASDSFSKKGSPACLDARNGVKHAKAGPLVLPGKVLPFRHQQHLCPPHQQLKSYAPFLRSMATAKRTLKDDFSKFRQVIFCDRTVKVTFQWEAEYRFSLDSKYTSHPLEKTISRAVHG